MKSRPLFATVGVLVCIALAIVFVGVPAPDALFHPARALPAGATLTHGAAWYRPFGAVYRVHDVRLQQGGGTITIDDLAIAGFRQTGQGATVRHLRALGTAGTGPQAAHFQADAIEMDRVLWPRAIVPNSIDAVRAIALRLRAGHAAMDGFSAASGLISATVRHVALSDLADGGVPNLVATGIAIKLGLPAPAGTITFSIDSDVARNTRLPWVDGYTLFSGDPARIAKVSPPGTNSSTHLQGLLLSAANFQFAMPDLISTSAMDTTGTLRVAGSAPKLSFDVTLPKAQTRLSAMLGLDTISGALSVNEVATTTKGGLALSTSLDLAQLGTLTEDFQATIAPAETARALAAGMAFDGGRIAWQDQGLTARILNYVAARKHVSAEQMRAGIVAALTARPNPLIADQADSNTQLANFVAHPGTLTFASTPAQPVAIASLKGQPAGAIAGLFNVHLSAN